IGGGDDRKFAPRNAVAKVDPEDAPPRDVAAHRHAVEHIRKVEVIDVPGAARHFCTSLFSGDGMSEEFFFHGFPRLSRLCNAGVAPAFRRAFAGITDARLKAGATKYFRKNVAPAVPGFQYGIRPLFRVH